jgi:hypothetical protein
MAEPLEGFDGGKMNHIYKIILDKRDSYYINEFESDEAELAFKAGKKYLKIHGENAMIFFLDDGNFVVTQRRDSKTDEVVDGSFPMPIGPNPSVYDNGAGRVHYYSYIPLDKTKIQGKGKRKTAIGPDTYAAIQKGIDLGIIIPKPLTWCSFEWVGAKHQGNIDDFPEDHCIMVHSTAEVKDEVVPKTFEEAEAFSGTHAVEGFVFQNPETGKFFKMRMDCFKNSLFKSMKKGDKTSIKPMVLSVDGIIPGTPDFFK